MEWDWGCQVPRYLGTIFPQCPRFKPANGLQNTPAIPLRFLSHQRRLEYDDLETTPQQESSVPQRILCWELIGWKVSTWLISQRSSITKRSRVIMMTVQGLPHSQQTQAAPDIKCYTNTHWENMYLTYCTGYFPGNFLTDKMDSRKWNAIMTGAIYLLQNKIVHRILTIQMKEIQFSFMRDVLLSESSIEKG